MRRWGMILLALWAGQAQAEVFIYRTPGGHTVFSDRALSKPNLKAANYAARRGPRKYEPPTVISGTPLATATIISPGRQAR